MFFKTTILLIFAAASAAHANCRVTDSRNQPVAPLHDPLYQLLVTADPCPKNVQEFKGLLNRIGLKTEPAMVANRGRHNAELGSFSFFETVSGRLPWFGEIEVDQFYFGHFTGAKNGKVELLQSNEAGNLMIELIVWDKMKGYYNFYELIGAGDGSQWFYRGDSRDAFLDNQYLYREVPPGQPRFGDRMRCSGCHVTGGPIMKEITFPYNDWWTISRPLPLAPNRPNAEVAETMSQLIDAREFSSRVVSGINRLEESRSYVDMKLELSLQEQLRPLFTDMEINIQSDLEPLAESSGSIQIPAAFFINPILSFPRSASFDQVLGREEYLQFLVSVGMEFPETVRRDADHAWLVPVKGLSDMKAIQTLMREGVVDEKFVLDVLSVDMERPLFSQSRASLLAAVPKWRTLDWRNKFAANLQKLAETTTDARVRTAAWELFDNFNDPDSVRRIQKKVRARQDEISVLLMMEEGQAQFCDRLVSDRQAVFDSQISQNPLGQILEPGFRVIFPQPTKYPKRPN